jgi:hypothetical protein
LHALLQNNARASAGIVPPISARLRTAQPHRARVEKSPGSWHPWNMSATEEKNEDRAHPQGMEWGGRVLLIAGIAFLFFQLAIELGLTIWARISGSSLSSGPSAYSVGLLILAAGIGLIFAAAIVGRPRTKTK